MVRWGMMILKTNRLRLFAILLIPISYSGRVGALDTFACVRDLMPITEQAEFQSHRPGLERPFLPSPMYMVFPEVANATVTGFYIYAPAGKAWYYDAVEAEESRSKRQLIADLKPEAPHFLLNLVAQPNGLETVSLLYLPGFGEMETTGEGPVMLGSSVLPVIGAFVSRPNSQLRLVYHNPADVGENDLKKWIYARSSRKPAAVSEIEITRKMMHLTTQKAKSHDQLWLPIQNELKLRKLWVQGHNLDEEAFHRLSEIMQTTCREDVNK